MINEYELKLVNEMSISIYRRGYEDGVVETEKINDKAHDDGYNKGLYDAWECARKILVDVVVGGFDSDTLKQIFGTAIIVDIFKINSASEAIAKIKEYEEQKNEIHVGDEVVSDAFDEKGIVTHINDKSCVSLICDMNSMINTSLDKVHKTGKSYPQIVEILEQLKGDKE